MKLSLGKKIMIAVGIMAVTMTASIFVGVSYFQEKDDKIATVSQVARDHDWAPPAGGTSTPPTPCTARSNWARASST